MVIGVVSFVVCCKIAAVHKVGLRGVHEVAQPCGVCCLYILLTVPTTWLSAVLAQTYVLFGGWGDFFHLFLSYFVWNLGTFLKISSTGARCPVPGEARVVS